ncbi:MAG: family 16 glycosylhydrolase [Capsulimonadaceae bacterium]|nr:family 16 glycosylhydrolase [Capsulimonadaceae bacterium]
MKASIVHVIAALTLLAGPNGLADSPVDAARQATFSVTGKWSYSSRVPGYEPGKVTAWTLTTGATATWRPAIAAAGPVSVSLWLPIYAGSDGHVQVQVVAGGQTATRFVDEASGESRWIDLGQFQFDGKGGELLRITKVQAEGAARIGAARFEIRDPNNPAYIWQSRILDALRLEDAKIMDASFTKFTDLHDGDELYQAAGLLAARKVFPGCSATSFGPDAPATRSEIAGALAAIAPGSVLPSGETGVSGAELIQTSAQIVRRSGKNLDWLSPDARISQSQVFFAAALGLIRSESDPIAKTPVLTRGEAVLLLRRLQRIVVDQGPPTNARWHMTFDDEFNGNTLDASRWKSAAGGDSWGDLLSSRWPENITVSGGMMRIVTRKEDRGGKHWTSGNVATRAFRQAYGYFEARYRYAGASGLNNAFWTTADLNGKHFEIDFNEGHYPDEICTSLHQKDARDQSAATHTGLDLSQDFHVYGCQWNEHDVTFYFDGKEIYRASNAEAHFPGPLIFSTAVLPNWAGPVTDALDGKSMDVDWVRAYEKQ